MKYQPQFQQQLTAGTAANALKTIYDVLDDAGLAGNFNSAIPVFLDVVFPEEVIIYNGIKFLYNLDKNAVDITEDLEGLYTSLSNKNY